MTMKGMAVELDVPYLEIIKQQTVTSDEALQQKLKDVLAKNGEGLMLHRRTAYYASGRSHDLLKLKAYTDAEATVIGYKPGKGKIRRPGWLT